MRRTWGKRELCRFHSQTVAACTCLIISTLHSVPAGSIQIQQRGDRQPNRPLQHNANRQISTQESEAPNLDLGDKGRLPGRGAV